MRALTMDETFMQMITVQKQRDAFIQNNTSPMAEYEKVNGEWIPVHKIRYTGATGTKNTFALI